MVDPHHDSPPQAEPSFVGRKSVRRRLVQSTLFPVKPHEPEINLDQRNDKNDEREDEVCEVETDECGSQKRKRQRKTKTTTPTKRVPSSKREKQNGITENDGTAGKNDIPKKNITPRKKGTPRKNGTRGVSSAQKSTTPDGNTEISPTIPDLRLEAKLIAEENSRMFAGRQVHPFFSSWKMGKKSQEAPELQGDRGSTDRKKKSASLGPIHVFEKTEYDQKVHLDWKNWKFCVEVSAQDKCGFESTCGSIFQDNISSLTFDKFPCVSHWCEKVCTGNKRSLVQCSNQCKNYQEAVDLTGDADDPLEFSDLPKDKKLNEAIDKGCLISAQAKSLNSLESKQQSRFLQERMVSYYVGRDKHPVNTLWTDKYQPNRSSEVCGNDESVKLLNDWLRHWRERNYQFRNPNKADESDFHCNNYSHTESDSDSDYTDEGTQLKNVLLITGPVGCGKSAAIYACAEEQGFEIMEVNASECRNGSLVKQRFGQALESHWLKRSLESHVDYQSRDKCHSALSNCKAKPDGNMEVVEFTMLLEEENLHDVSGAGKFSCKVNGSSFDQKEVRPLILFEDVDITFLEDRGFIASIQHIAETAKGPLILTSNNSNLVLPENLDRLEIYFETPPLKELLSHAYMVCAVENTRIRPHLIERLIRCCSGDIRKTIMHLQFWCQGNGNRKEATIARKCNPMLFDLDAGHKVLPKLLPWEFPSELPKLIDMEITNALSAMKEYSCSMEIVNEGLEDEEVQAMEGMALEELDMAAKKEAMLRNCSMYDDDVPAPHSNGNCDFSRSPGTPIPFSHRKGRRKLEIVLSSDSEDEISNGQAEPLQEDIQGFHSRISLCDTAPENGFSKGNMNTCFLPCPDKEQGPHTNDLCRSADVSCVPESSYVPETEIGTELSTETISFCHVETLEVPKCNGTMHDPSPVEAQFSGKSLTRLCKLSDILENTCDTAADFNYREREDLQYEYGEAVIRGYPVLDECSRMDFNRRHKSVSPLGSRLAPNPVQDAWKRLRMDEQLKRGNDKQLKDASQAMHIAKGICNLISDADIFYHCRAAVEDWMDPATIISEEPEHLECYYEQWHMVSTFFQHGLCTYAKDVASLGSMSSCQAMVDLPWKMLAFTTNRMALAKLILEDMCGCMTSEVEMHLPDMDNLICKRKTCVFDVVRSVIPPRLCLSLRDEAFHEYTASLENIAKAEASRLTEGMGKGKRRRGRVARHYLSIGALLLSPEDISLLEKGYISRNSQPSDGSL